MNLSTHTGDFGVMHGMQGVLLDSSGFVKCPLKTFVEQLIETGQYTALVTFLATSSLLRDELAEAGPVSKYWNITIFRMLGIHNRSD